jgi:hypothetical protein
MADLDKLFGAIPEIPKKENTSLLILGLVILITGLYFGHKISEDNKEKNINSRR